MHRLQRQTSNLDFDTTLNNVLAYGFGLNFLERMTSSFLGDSVGAAVPCKVLLQI